MALQLSRPGLVLQAPPLHGGGHTDRQTDRQTDGRTDGQTDRLFANLEAHKSVACGQRGRAGPACSLGNPYAKGGDPPEEPLALYHPIQRRHNPAGSPARAAGGSGGYQGAHSEEKEEEDVIGATKLVSCGEPS